LGLPLAANTYVPVSGAELPDQFIVYQLISSPPAQHADDAETLRRYRVQVSFYSRTGLASLPGVDAAMTGAGYTRGPQRELPYNQLTRHYGLALEYLFLNEE
jgi:hypothetical protein